MSNLTLEKEHIIAAYDEASGLLRITYRGELTPDVTADFYTWLGETIRQHGALLTSARGSIYDFRQVTKFKNNNLTSAQRQSQHLNQRVDMSNHPVALLVGNLYQEQLLRVTMKIQPGQDRKRIVHSEAEALTFIDHFHEMNRHPEP